jgi:hypothetical protein
MTIAITICVIAVGLLFLPFLSPGDSVFLQNIDNISYPLHSLVFLEEYANEVLWYTFAFASEDGGSDEENGDDENGDDENDGDTGDLASTTERPSTNDDNKAIPLPPVTPPPTLPAMTGDLGASPPNPIGKTGDLKPSIVTNGRTSDLGSSQTGRDGDVGVLGGNTDISSRAFTHNAEKITQELAGKTPLEISQYPISALSTEDLKLVFGFLDPVNLGKVLLNISLQDLQTIQERLSVDFSFSDILTRLSLADRTEVERRLSPVQ